MTNANAITNSGLEALAAYVRQNGSMVVQWHVLEPILRRLEAAEMVCLAARAEWPGPVDGELIDNWRRSRGEEVP